jgi:superoxide reductase
MKRRDAFKKIGLAGIALSTLGIAMPVLAQSQDIAKDNLIINRQKMKIADTDSPTEFELKHTPEIQFLETDEKGFTLVKIHIGSGGIVHPTLENHWIDYMKIYKNDKLVASIEFEKGSIRGFSENFIKLEKGNVVLVEIGCNLHGIWSNTAIF